MNYKLNPPWGPLGRVTYERTYQRPKADGGVETWEETVSRVVDGNLALVDKRFEEPGERDYLYDAIGNFRMCPGGRHLWATGVIGRQFLSNCFTSAWSKTDVTLHSSYLFDQLMQGGGVGVNYSSRYISDLPPVASKVELHLVCDSEHKDFNDMKEYLSFAYSDRWHGVYQIQDSREGWVAALELLLRSHWSAGNGKHPLVIGLSLLRPNGSFLRTFGGRSSGPAPFAEMLFRLNQLLNARVGKVLNSFDWMSIDHECARVVVAGGIRRSSRISIKSWKDSDILEFITCKSKNETDHWSTNISVEIDDEFINLLGEGQVVYNGHCVMQNRAIVIHNAVVASMLVNGEPGYWNIDHARRAEAEPELMYCTNPCGELSLSPFDVCTIGSVNLQYNTWDDFDNFRYMARFLLRATFGDATRVQQQEIVARNRRIGVGFLGFHNWLALAGIRYSDAFNDERVRCFLRVAKSVVRDSADRFAWQLRIPSPVTVTTVPPTGSISLLSGVSSGIQPLIAKYFYRRIQFQENDPALIEHEKNSCPIEDCKTAPRTKVVTFACKDSLIDRVRRIGFDPDVIVQDQSELTIEDFLRVQRMIQEEYLDNGCSFTINIKSGTSQHVDNNGNFNVTAIANIIKKYLPYVRGFTMMVDKTRTQAPFERITKEEYETTDIPRMEAQVEDECHNGVCPIK